MRQLLVFSLLVFNFLCLGQVRIKDLPSADPSQITTQTVIPIDDPTYGVRSLPIGRLFTNSVSLDAIADATTNRAIVVDATATDLVALDATQARVAISLGRNARGDGAGGRFYFVAGASTSHTNYGTVWRDGANTGNWYWDLSQAPDGGIPVTLFGADTSGTLLCDTAIEATMNWCYEPTHGSIPSNGTREYYAQFPPGTYRINSILNDKGISMVGTADTGRYPAGIGTWAPYKNGVVLWQEVGATEDAVTLYGRGATIKNMSIVGRKESNTLTKKAITAVTSRTVFNVAVGDIPGTHPSVAFYPFYGHCFFFSPAGRYLGSAIVQSVNSGTGQITLMSGSDFYATPTGSSQLLTTSCKVIFSPVKQYNFNGTLTGNPRPDPTSVGPAGICLSHEPLVGAGRHRVENVNVTWFHTGIRTINHSHAQFEGILANSCQFAGVSSGVIGQSADDEADGIWIQGVYEPEDGTNESVDNYGYRNTAAAYHSPAGYSYVSTITADNTVIGLDLSWGVKRSYFGFVATDSCVGQALRVGDMDGNCETVINYLQIRAPSGSLAPIPAYTLEAITVLGTGTGNLAIGELHAGDNNNISNSRYPYIIKVSNPNARVTIQHVGEISVSGTVGNPQWRRTAEANFPRVLSWDSKLSVDQVGSGLLDMAGPLAIVAQGKANIFSWPNEQVVIGNKDNNTGANGTKVTMRANQVSVGGDASDFFGHTRTSGSDKYFELLVPERTPGTYPLNEYGLIGASAENAKNRVFVGGHPGSGRAAATEVQIYAASAVSTTQLSGSPIVHVQGSNRRVGINTTAPTSDLSVNGTADKPGGGSWGTFSDRRLKHVLSSYEKGLAEVLRINPIVYRYNGEGGIKDTDTHAGIVAQEFGDVFPDAVKPTGPELMDGSKSLTVQQDELIWALVNAVKTLNSELNQLKAKHAP